MNLHAPICKTYCSVAKMRQQLEKPKIAPTQMSPEKALALMKQTSMTRDGYILCKQTAKAEGENLYPPYLDVLAAKKATWIPMR